MSSGHSDDTMPRGNAMRITYSREFLLSIGGSEACKKLPAGIDASVLRGSYATGLWTSEAAWAYFRAERWDGQWGGHASRGREWDSPARAAEPEPFQTGAGTKSNICFRFFSASGYRFGDGCSFLHYCPGGHHQAVAEMTKTADPALPGGLPMEPAVPDGPPKPTPKTGFCKPYMTAQGCKWVAKCTNSENSTPPLTNPTPMQNPTMANPAIFGATTSAKISVDASLAGAIIGRGGVNTRKIFRVTGAKVSIRDHESDASLNNIELQGTFDQIKDASTMVSKLIASIGGSAPPLAKSPAARSHSHHGGGQGSKFKTKLCVFFTEGFCTHGDRCLYAHGDNELRK